MTSERKLARYHARTTKINTHYRKEDYDFGIDLGLLFKSLKSLWI